MVERLTPAELRAELDAGSVQVVDTRPPEEYAAGHVPGAENVPFREFTDRVEDIEWGDSVVLVCQEGISSQQAGRLLESYAGVDRETTVASLAGGYDAWDGDLVTD